MTGRTLARILLGGSDVSQADLDRDLLRSGVQSLVDLVVEGVYHPAELDGVRWDTLPAAETRAWVERQIEARGGPGAERDTPRPTTEPSDELVTAVAVQALSHGLADAMEDR